MSIKIHKCGKCKIYTLKDKCPRCGNKTVTAHPAKFSPDDPYLELKVKAIVKNLT